MVSLALKTDEIKDITIMLGYLSNKISVYCQRNYIEPNLGKHIYTMTSETNFGFNGTFGALMNYIEFYNRDISYLSDDQLILVLSSDHIYGMDYRELIRFHVDKDSDITIVATEVSSTEAHRFGVLSINEDQKVIDFEEKPSIKPDGKTCLVNCGIYIFSVKTIKYLQSHVDGYDIGSHVLPKAVSSKNISVFAYKFDKFWGDIGTPTSYYQTCLNISNLHYLKGLLRGGSLISKKNEPWPTDLVNGATVIGDRTKIQGGSIIDGGRVVNSVVSEDCYIGPGCSIENSVLMPGTILLKNVQLKNVLTGMRVCMQDVKFGFNIGNEQKDFPELFYNHNAQKYPWNDDGIIVVFAGWNNTGQPYNEIREKTFN